MGGDGAGERERRGIGSSKSDTREVFLEPLRREKLGRRKSKSSKSEEGRLFRKSRGS